MNRPDTYQPQSDYLVTMAQFYSDLDRETLVYLYQPLIGPLASVLYQSFWTEAKQHPLFSKDRHAHTRLMVTLGMGMDKIYAARRKLEAVGLIKTYTQVDPITNSRHYVYEMYAPLAPNAFLNDDLLSIALFDMVGAQRFSELGLHFELTPVRRDDMQDISAKFTDVFTPSDPSTVPAEVQAIREATERMDAPLPRIDINTVDWDLLTQVMGASGVQAAQILKNQAPIAQLAGFYGLSTTQLGRLLGTAVNAIDGSIDMRRLRLMAEQQFEKKARDSAASTVDGGAPVDYEVAQRVQQKPPAQASQLTKEDQQLLARAKSQAPRDFMENEKHRAAPGAFVAKNESVAVRKLVERNLFDDATVNVLVAYTLQERENSLNTAFMDAVANRWITAGVDSPETAIAQIHLYQAGGTKKQQNRPRRYGRQQRKEPLPDWAQPGYKVPTTEVTPAVRADLAERLARLRDNNNKGQS